MNPAAALLAIGGALDLSGPATILRHFYHLAGGRLAHIAILPTASTQADSGQDLAAALQGLGLDQPAQVLPVFNRQAAGQAAILDTIEQASAIFLTGGNQLRLSTLLGGTPLEAALHRACRRGSVIAGTSAGAAALSAIMIASGHGGPTPRSSQLHMTPGLGFTDRLIFDQHFRQRDRLGRLIYAISLHPRILGAGIDENTAAVLQDNTLSVIGANAVTIVDGLHLQTTDAADLRGRQPVAVSGLRLHVLTHGCRFDLDQRQAWIPAKLLPVD